MKTKLLVASIFALLAAAQPADALSLRPSTYVPSWMPSAQTTITVEWVVIKRVYPYPWLRYEYTRAVGTLRTWYGATVGTVVVTQTIYGNTIRTYASADAAAQALMVKRAELMEAVFDNSIDELKASYEEAKEQFKKALQILIDHQARQAQVIQKLTA